jgi:hypothetical protein
MLVTYKRKKLRLKGRAEGVVHENKTQRRYTKTGVSPMDGDRRRGIGELFEAIRQDKQSVPSGCGK